MTLGQALDEAMYGPFSTGYAITSFLSAVGGYTEVVISTNMDPDTAVVRNPFHQREWRFAFYNTEADHMDWRPLLDSQVQAQVDKAYNNPERYVL